MSGFRKFLLGTAIVIFLIGALTCTVNAQGDGQESYKNLLNTLDGSIRALRLRGENDAVVLLENAQWQYNSLVENRNNFENKPKLLNLHDKINDKFDNLQQSPDQDGIRELRGMTKEMASKLDIELSFIYEHALIVILLISFTLAIIVNMISRTVVDWEKVNEVKRKSSELRDKLKEARRRGKSKEVHKLMREQKEFMRKHAGVMFSPFKTMFIIIIPFMIIFWVLNNTYGGWVVAWMPFNLPWPDIGLPLLSRFFPGTVASLSFFGWYLLSYFGFSMVWRRFLIPSS